MKSLQESLVTTESLFDDDLTSKELPHEELLKSTITKADIEALCYGLTIGDFGEIKNKLLADWAKDFRNRMYNGGTVGKSLATFGIIEHINRESTKEAMGWLDLGRIHKSTHHNDMMYAVELDISWLFWGNNNSWKNITEWIMFVDRKPFKKNPPTAFVLANRDIYDPSDQMVIHRLIEIASKKGAR